jgi:predicted nuclease of predicted toxin-antitoxin system
MKFLVDVNASGSLVDGLMHLGHDVSAVAEKDPRMRDEDILCWATSEQRIIVTTDHDFEAIDLFLNNFRNLLNNIVIFDVAQASDQ